MRRYLQGLENTTTVKCRQLAGCVHLQHVQQHILGTVEEATHGGATHVRVQVRFLKLLCSIIEQFHKVIQV